MFGKKKTEAKPAKKKRVYDTVPAVRRGWQMVILSLLLTLIVEGFNRGSLLKLLTFIIEHPLFMLFGWLIVFTTLMFSELFKHRKGALTLISVIWLALGIGNFLVIHSRTQPLAFMDMFMFGEAIKLTTLYYTIPQIILMYGGILVGVVAVIWAVTKLPRRKRVRYAAATSVCAGLVVACFCIYTVAYSYGVFPKYYDDLIAAYDRYGFVECFVSTIGSFGVSKPTDYSEETVTDIIEEIDVTATEAPVETAVPEEESALPVFTEADDLAHPNIIYVQLESFFDLNTVIGPTYSEDPTPNFTKLTEECPHGELYMPSIGGGTANSEFEMLTGFSLDFFTTGEYPYSTVLKEQTCGSIAYDLLAEGYSTTSMHDSTATFYGRNTVYPRLGFQHFVSLEYMPFVSYTDIGWAQDMVLDTEIMRVLQETEERDFIMAITVESHGKYSSEYTYKEGDIDVEGIPEQINEAEFRNYMNTVHDVDRFIGQLVKDLSMLPEPTVVVFYGDHLPSLNLTNDILTTGNVYASRYIIWNNYGAEFTGGDCEAYRLTANLLGQLGISGGVISRLHQSYPLDCKDEDYMSKLETLEYDLLYGDQAAYESGAPEAVDMMMGSSPIEITSVSNQYRRVLIYGKGFTEFSNIILDGQTYPTAFVSSSQIVCVVPKNLTVNEVVVAQVAEDGTELSRTDTFYMSEQAS